MWSYFKGESLAFKSICAYMFVEYFRPQRIYTFLDFAPWAQMALILALVGIISDPKSRLKWSSQHTFVLLFTIAIHLSFLVAFDISYSKEYYIVFVQWIIVFYLITTIVTTKERLYILFLVIFVCSLKVAIGTTRIFAMRGFSFTKWGLVGPPGYFQNSGELAILMLTLIPFGFYFLKRSTSGINKWEKLLIVLAFICPLLTILGASSRGAQIAVLVQFMIIFWKQIFKPKVLILCLALSWGAWNILPEEQKERFTSIGEDKTSIQRTLYWENGWEMMKNYPVLGVGFWNFIPYYAAHYPQDMLYETAQLPHNIFIQVGTDGGFTALSFFLAIILISLLKKFPGKYKTDQNILFLMWKSNKIAIIGYLVAGQFVTVVYYPFLWIAISIQCCITVASLVDKRD